jgi:hypothetical protein
VTRKKTHVLFVVRDIIFVDSGNENGCSGWIRSVVCVLGGRLVFIMIIARMRRRHRANDVTLADRTGSSSGGKPWCTIGRSVYEAGHETKHG